MISHTLHSLSIILRREINKLYLKNKYSILNKPNPFNIETLLPIVSTYNNNDWVNFKYLINLHSLTLNRFTDQNKYTYYKDFCIEKKEKDYYKLKLPYTDSIDLFDMYLIKWCSDAETPIHQHPKMGCILKVLEGDLIETRMHTNIPTAQIIKAKEGTINYIDNTIGIHSIKNGKKSSYSLHIYGKDIVSYKDVNNFNINNLKTEKIISIKQPKPNFSIIKYFALK